MRVQSGFFYPRTGPVAGSCEDDHGHDTPCSIESRAEQLFASDGNGLVHGASYIVLLFSEQIHNPNAVRHHLLQFIASVLLTALPLPIY
jgi:hypothetical protein